MAGLGGRGATNAPGGSGVALANLVDEVAGGESGTDRTDGTESGAGGAAGVDGVESAAVAAWAMEGEGMNATAKDLVREVAAGLRREVEEMGAAVVCGPRDYEVALPHEGFLKELGELLRKRTPGYAREAWDCDDFALWAVTEASLCLPPGAGCGHSVLYCAVRITEGEELNGIGAGPHATCLVKCVDGWRFFEPQNGRYCNAKDVLDRGVVGAIDFVLL